MSDSGVETFRHALTVARKHGFAEVAIETSEFALEAKLDPVKIRSKSGLDLSKTPTGAGAPETTAPEILATLVGYYQASTPPMEVGKTVSKGQVIAIISALGLANEVESTLAGEITEILVKEGQPVEFGQPLARLMSE